MTPLEVIEAVLNATHQNQRTFLQKTGVSSSTFSEIKSGRTQKISRTLANRINDAFPQFSIEWLMTGEGEMYAKDVNAPVFQNSGNNVNNHQEAGVNTRLLDLLEEKDKQINRLLTVVENLSRGGSHD